MSGIVHRIPITIEPSSLNRNNAFIFSNGCSYDITDTKARISSYRIPYSWRLIKAGVNDKLYMQIFGTQDDFVTEITIPENTYPDIDSFIISLNNGLASSSFTPVQVGHFTYNSTKVDGYPYSSNVRFQRTQGSDTEIELIGINGIELRILPDKDLKDKFKNQSINKVLGCYKLGSTTGTTKQKFIPSTHQSLTLSIEILNLKTLGNMSADGASIFSSFCFVDVNHGGMIHHRENSSHPVYLANMRDSNYYIDNFEVRLTDAFSGEPVDFLQKYSFVLEFLK